MTAILAEEWRPVTGFVGLYEVSNLGRVRSRDRVRIYQLAQGPTTITRRGKILTQSWGARSPYPKVYLTDGPTRVCVNVHRMVAEAFLGPCPDGYWVNHIDGRKTNPKVENLEYCTPSENQRHAHAMGLGRWAKRKQPDNGRGPQ